MQQIYLSRSQFCVAEWQLNCMDFQLDEIRHMLLDALRKYEIRALELESCVWIPVLYCSWTVMTFRFRTKIWRRFKHAYELRSSYRELLWAHVPQVRHLCSKRRSIASFSELLSYDGQNINHKSYWFRYKRGRTKVNEVVTARGLQVLVGQWVKIIIIMYHIYYTILFSYIIIVIIVTFFIISFVTTVRSNYRDNTGTHEITNMIDDDDIRTLQ